MILENDIPKHILPRSDFLVQNFYDVAEQHERINFHVVVYFLEEYKCKIVVRCLNEETWGHDLKIVIFDENNQFSQRVSIGSSEENCKIIEIYTKIRLVKLNDLFPGTIPKTIVQTYETTQFKNLYHKNAVYSLLENNPQFEYVMFDDSNVRTFIETEFKENILSNDEIPNEMKSSNSSVFVSDVLKAYDMIVPGALRADLFRYCYLYLHGGYYFDHKMVCKRPLVLVTNPEDTLIFSDDEDEISHYNGMIFCSKEHPIMLKCIKQCVKNVLNKFYGSQPHETTGNRMFYQVIKQEKSLNTDIKPELQNLKPQFPKRDNTIYYYSQKDKREVVVAYVCYKNYYQNYWGSNANFRNFFGDKGYFFRNMNLLGDFAFFIIPYPFGDRFEIKHLKKNIYAARRVDSNEGWGLELKVKVLHYPTNQSETIIIGNSQKQEKVFLVENIIV